MIGEGGESLELTVDRLGARKGVEARAERHEGGDLRAVDIGAREHALQGGAWGVVASAQPRADALFADELDGGQEEVLEEAELMAVERVDGGEGGERVIPEIAEQFADVGPVLLLDVGVVVFLVGPPAGELDGVGLAVIVEVAVDELGAVIGVDAPQAEGQGELELGERVLNAVLVLAEDGPRLHPRRVDVGDVEGMHELAIGGVAGMTDEIDLREARRGDVPAIGLQGDVVLEQGPGLGAAVEALLELPLVRCQAAIDLAGADREEVALDDAGEMQAAPGPRQPEREQCLEAYGPRIAGCLPDHPERLNDGQPVRGGAPTPGAGVVVARGGPGQQARGMLPVIAGGPAALIQDPALLRARRLPIAAMNP